VGGVVAVFPLFAALVSLACAALIGRDALARPRPEKISWAIAFLLFAIASGAEAAAGFDEWTPLLVRIFYLAGAVLVVAFLGLGELYLVAPRRMEAIRVVPGLALLVAAVGATLVWSAPLDQTRLAEDGWEAMERGPALIALVALCSGVGTLILVGGALWSAWSFWRLGSHRHRMYGCLLIALGTLVVAAKGTLGRTGLPEETFAIALAAGVTIIFAGYLETRRSDAPRPVAIPLSTGVPDRQPSQRPVAPARTNGRHPDLLPATDTSDPVIAFIERRFLTLDEPALSELARVWSVPPRGVDVFARGEARQVWRLRQRLSAGVQERFDDLSVPARLQLVELYREVLANPADPAEPLSDDQISFELHKSRA
jgi:hypothetical protein